MSALGSLFLYVAMVGKLAIACAFCFAVIQALWGAGGRRERWLAWAAFWGGLLLIVQPWGGGQ